MDFVQCLVRAIIDGGKPAYRDFLDRGIPDELLMGEYRPALDYIYEHLSKNSEIPGVDIIEGKLGLPLPPNPAGSTAGFWADEILTNAIGSDIKTTTGKVLNYLENQQILKSVDEMQQSVFRIQKLQIGGGDSRITSLFEEGPKVWDYYERMKKGERGILTPWPTINDSTLGFNPEELILFVARSGIGKCLSESATYVDPDTGLEHTIKECFDDPKLQRVLTWSKERGIHGISITQKVDTGRKRCLRLTFSSGRSITVTPEHPLLTAEGWKRADEFKVGMTSALSSRIPFPEVPVGLPSETVFILALLLAEGSYTGHHVGFTTASKEILRRAKVAASTFGNVRVQYRGRYNYDFVRLATSGPNSVLDLLRAHGIDNTLARHKTIPDAVYRLPPPQLSEFLSTFWMCDGYVDKSGPSLVLASERMVRQIQHLLLRFGIQSRVSYKKAVCNGKKFDSWRLRVYSFSWDDFAVHVPLWGNKLRVFKSLLAKDRNTKDRNTNVGYPRVSDAFKSEMESLVVSSGGRWGDGKFLEIAKRLGRYPSHKPGHHSYWDIRELFGCNNSLRLRPFRVFCEVYGIESKYQWLWNSDLFWDVIEHIEDVGEQKIYDLTVEPTSCFIANDVIVHNTWASLLIAHRAWAGPGKKYKVLYVTTEMSKLLIALRFYAIESKLPYGLLRSGNLDIYQEAKLKKYCEELLKESGISIIGGNFDFRIETLAAAIDEDKPDLVVIDGIYLIQGVPGKDRIERAANVFGDVKRLCTRKKLPIVVTSQFNREVKVNNASTARAESVALTDAAVWHSTLIFGMVQTDDNKKERRMQWKQLKVRDGTGEDFEANWNFELMDFSEIPKAPVSGPAAGNLGDAAEVGDALGSEPTDIAPF